MCTVIAVMIDNYGCMTAVTGKWEGHTTKQLLIFQLDCLFNNLGGLRPPRWLNKTVSLNRSITITYFFLFCFVFFSFLSFFLFFFFFCCLKVEFTVNCKQPKYKNCTVSNASRSHELSNHSLFSLFYEGEFVLS